MNRPALIIAAVMAACLSASQPAPEQTILVGSTDTGAPLDAPTYGGGLNRTGRYAIFSCAATNLNGIGEFQAYRKDLLTGTVELVSITPDGRRSNGASSKFITPNARWITFESNKVFGDETQEFVKLYLKDMLTGEIESVCTSSSGESANGDSWGGSLSDDGRYVAFWSYATNLMEGIPSKQVYVKDTLTGALTCVSAHNSQFLYSAEYGAPLISADGSKVLFMSQESAFPSDAGSDVDIFLKDLRSDELSMISNTSAGANMADSNVSLTGATPDFRFVTFTESKRYWIPEDNNFKVDLVRKDTRTGEAIAVGVHSGGSFPVSGTTGGSISADGRFVVLQTIDSYVEGDTNGKEDIYLKDLLTGQFTLISVTPRGVGGNAKSSLGYLNESGNVVLFHTLATNLVSETSNKEKLLARNTGNPSGLVTSNTPLATDLFIGKKVTLSTTLREKVSRDPVVGESVMFMMDSALLGTAITNAYGVPKFQWIVPEGTALGNHNFFVSFAGTLSEARSDGEITVVAKPGPSVLTVPNKEKPAGQKVVLAATLKNASVQPLPGRTIIFFIDGVNVGTGVTDATGLAKFEYTIPVGTAVGSHELKARFAGDTTHTAKNTFATLTVT